MSFDLWLAFIAASTALLLIPGLTDAHTYPLRRSEA